MPYRNPNTCISERYFAQQEQAAWAANYSMMNGMFTVVLDPDTLSRVNTSDGINNQEAEAGFGTSDNFTL